MLWMPLWVAWLSPASKESAIDNRFLANLPPWPRTGAEWAAYPDELERTWNDRLGLRTPLIRSHAWIKVKLLGVSPSESILVGKEGWFYLNDPEAVTQYQGIALLSEAQLERWRVVLEQRRAWLAQRGIQYLVVFVPNKHSIYPEFMPDVVPRLGAENSLATLSGYLARNSDLPILDLSPILREAKSRKRVYHRTDTHWNGAGAFLGYKAILQALEEGGLEPPAAPSASVRLEQYETDGIGLTSLVGLSPLYREERIDVLVVAPRASVEPEFRKRYSERVRRQLPFAYGVDDPALPRAVVFRDSFANALIPYLSESFQRTLYVWDRDLRPGVVETERPDVVIQQIAERLILREPESIEDSRR
jgi:alginate O-acetyltransferase complex protein AlgJ